MKLTFWVNEPNLHLAPLCKAIAGRPHDVAVVTERELPRMRLDLGWVLPDYGPSDLIVAPDPSLRREIEADRRGGVHFFTGLGSYRQTRGSFFRITDDGIRRPEHVFVFSEPWDIRGWRLPVRRVRYRTMARLMRKRINTFLAAGPLAAAQFAWAGIPQRKIAPFGYFLDVPKRTCDLTVSDLVRMTFMGQYIPRKAPVDLISAARSLRGTDWSMDLYGTGPLGAHLKNIAAPLKGVEISGRVPSGSVTAVLDATDVLVLPSRFDGWGAVVNEALASGCRVIASDKVQAGILLGRNGERGVTFEAGNILALAQALSEEIRRGPRSIGERRKVIRWARIHASSEMGADYLLRLAGEPSRRWPNMAPWET